MWRIFITLFIFLIFIIMTTSSENASPDLDQTLAPEGLASFYPETVAGLRGELHSCLQNTENHALASDYSSDPVLDSFVSPHSGRIDFGPSTNPLNIPQRVPDGMKVSPFGDLE